MKRILIATPLVLLFACGSSASSSPEPSAAPSSTEPAAGDPVAAPEPEPAAVGNAACSLPFDPGPCEGAMPVWYFDSGTGRCEQETYGECEGNDNNFATRDECVAACGGG
jgi:hypothetical protein